MASRVTKKLVNHVNECIILFLTRYLCSEHIIPLKQLSIADFANVDQDGLFRLSIVTSPLLNCDVNHVNECIILFLTRYLCSEHIIPLKQLSIADFANVDQDGLFRLSIVTSPLLICDVTQTWCTGIVTSYSSIVLARANWCKADLNWWITIFNIEFSLPSIHGLACKKGRTLPFAGKHFN